MHFIHIYSNNYPMGLECPVLYKVTSICYILHESSFKNIFYFYFLMVDFSCIIQRWWNENIYVEMRNFDKRNSSNECLIGMGTENCTSMHCALHVGAWFKFSSHIKTQY